MDQRAENGQQRAEKGQPRADRDSLVQDNNVQKTKKKSFWQFITGRAKKDKS